MCTLQDGKVSVLVALDELTIDIAGSLLSLDCLG